MLGSTARTCLRAAGALLLSACLAHSVYAQSAPAGPQAPVKAPEIKRIPSNSDAGIQQPPIPVEEIIRRFTENETELAKAALGYTYRKAYRLEEFGNDGKSNGKSEVTMSVVNGQPQHANGEQDSTLRLLSLDRDALQSLAMIPAFPLKSDVLSKYQLSYEGMAPVDELMTYVFRVTPARLERQTGYFDGLVWVDSRDLTIVKTYGKWMTEIGPQSPREMPFVLYESYRQPVANKYWFPSYMRSDGMVSTKTGNVPVRLVVRWENFEVTKPGQEAPRPSSGDPDAPHMERGDK